MWENKIGAHSDWWGNDLCLRGATLSNSGVVVDTTVMISAWGRKVLCIVIDEKGDTSRMDTTHCRRGIMGYVVTFHVFIPRVLWLPSCSDVLDRRGYILPVFKRLVITGSVYGRELITNR
jgi:hypothetical protein